MNSEQTDSLNDVVEMFVMLRDGYSPEWRGGDVKDGVLYAPWVDYGHVIYAGLTALQRVGVMLRESAVDAEGDAGRAQRETAFESYARIKDKQIECLTADEVAVTAQYLLRGNRYNEGLIKSWIDHDKQLERLVRRGLELLG